VHSSLTPSFFTCSLPQPTRPLRRKFGTVLSANSPPPPPRSSVKKIKARRVSNFEATTPKKISTSSTRTVDAEEYTVIFEAGPIGLQLEAAGDSECRVQRFVDGGPNSPGPARMAGKIRPGDRLVQVNGEPVESYAAAVTILRESTVRRAVTFQSAWSSLEDSQQDAPGVAPPRTPKVPGTAKRTPAVSKSTLKPPPPTPPPLMSSISNIFASPQRSGDTVSPITKETTSADEPGEDEHYAISKIADNSDDCDVLTLQAPKETILQSHVLNTFPQKKSSSLTTPTKASETMGTPDKTVARATNEPKPTTQVELDEAQLARTKLEDKLQRLEEEMRLFDQSKEETQRQLEDSQRTVEEKTAALQQTQHELESLQVEFSQHNSSLLDENKNLDDRLQQAQHDLTNAEAAVARSESRLCQLEDSKKELAEELLKTTREHTHASEQVQALRQENETLVQRLDQVESELSSAKASATLSDARLCQLEDLKSGLEQELQSTKEKTQASEKRGGALFEENKTLVDRLYQVVTELSNAKAAATESDSLLHQLKDSKSALEVELETMNGLAQELQSAEAKIQAFEMAGGSLSDENKIMVDRLEQVESELSNAKAAATESDSQVRQLEDAKSALERDLESMNGLAQELQSSKAKIQDFEKAGVSLSDENKIMVDRLDQVDSELSNAKAAATESDSLLRQLEDSKNALEVELESMNGLAQELQSAEAKIQAFERAGGLLSDENKIMVDRLDQVESELSVAKVAATQSDSRLHQLEDAKSALERDLESTKYHEQELRSAKEETQAFEKTGDALSEENKVLVDRLDQLESELSSAKDATRQSDSLLRQLEESKSALEVELESMKGLAQELQSTEEKTKAFEKAGGALSDENKVLVERLTEVESELSSAKAAAKQSDSLLRQLEDAKSALEVELESMKGLAQELQSATKDFEKAGGVLSDENKVLVDRLAEIESELSSAKTAATQSDSRLRKLEDSKSALELELESTKNQSKAIATSTSSSTSDLLNLIRSKDERLAEYSDDLKVAQAAIHDLRKDLTSKSTALENTSTTLEQVRTEKMEFANDITRLTIIIDDATGEKMSLQERLYRSQDKLSELSKNGLLEKETLQKESAGVKEKLEDDIESKDQALTEALETINLLKYESDGLTATVDKLRTAARYSSDDESRLRTSLEKARSELAEAETCTSAIQTQLLEEQGRRSTAEEQIRSTDEQLVEALADLESARTEIDMLSAELSRSEANLEAVTNMLDTLEDEKNEVAHRETKLRSELEKRTQELLHDTSAVNEAKLTEARSEIADLQREIRSLESSKVLSQREIEYLSTANDKMSTKIQELRQDVDEAESQLSTKTMELMASKSMIEDLRVDLRQKNDELEQSQVALDKVKAQYSLLSDRLSHVAEESTKEKESIANDLINALDELAETNSRNMDLERLLRSMRRTISDSEARAASVREQLHEERASRKEVIMSADAAKAKLEETIANLSKGSEKYHSLFVSLQAEHDELKIDNDCLGKEIEALTNEASVSRATSERNDSEFNQELDELRRLLSDERGKGKGLAERMRDALFEADELRREVDTKRRRHEEQLRLITQDTDLKTRKHAEILESMEKDTKDLHQSRLELKQAQSEISRLGESLQCSQGETDYLSTLIDDLKLESATKIDELSKSHLEEVGLLTKDKEELESTLRRSEDQIEDIRNQLYAAEEGLLSSQAERERLLTEKNDVSAALHKAEDSLAELELCMLQDEKELSCDETVGDDLAGLSKSELQSKCIALQDELLEAESRVTSTASDVEQRARHVRRLEEDLAMMSDEITKLVDINGHFEQHLREIKSAKETSDAGARSSNAKAQHQENLSKDLEDRLDQQQNRSQSLTEELQSLQIDIENTQQEARDREAGMQSKLTNLKMLLKKAGEESERAVGDTARAQQELEAVVKQKIESSRRISKLERDMSELRLKLSDVEHERNALRNDAKGHDEQSSEEIESLTEECASLRTRVAGLEVEVEKNRVDLDIKEENERALSEQLEKLRSEVLEKDQLREEVASKLGQASRAVASQKESVAALEARALEAERTSSLYSDQIRKLQGTVKKIEASSDTSGNLRMKQLQELERKCSMLDEERNTVRAESNTLRDELRQARRQAAESQQMNDSLQSRVDSLKEKNDKTKAELRAARTAGVNTTTSSQTLVNELDSKQMEVHHLKAKVQVFSATIARMKSDRILLQEAALQAEFKNAASHDKSEEVSRLKSELHTKTSKLDSLSAVYRSQQQVLALSQSLEEQLSRFIEDIILQAGKVFSKISNRSLYLEKFGSRVTVKQDIKALDLAGLDRPTLTITELRSCLDDLSSIIPKALSDLSEKKEQLKSWKERRSLRSPQPGTPPTKSQVEAAPPGIMGDFQQMKRVLNEEVFSPGKARRTDASKLDMEYFHKVIHSLESQIDGLLADLKSANDALKAKDQMFVDLERLVSHHESERDILEKKLESMNKIFHDMEDRLNQESSWKEAAEKELASLRDGLDLKDTIHCSDEGRAAAKMAAGRLIVNCLENKSKLNKAACFRQWACSTSALRAVAQQSYAAAALAQQLETTREKLVILKRHLKKSRGGRDSGLARILEGYETT
jgi:chromosome segregation ATPase